MGGRLFCIQWSHHIWLLEALLSGSLSDHYLKSKLLEIYQPSQFFFSCTISFSLQVCFSLLFWLFSVFFILWWVLLKEQRESVRTSLTFCSMQASWQCNPQFTPFIIWKTRHFLISHWFQFLHKWNIRVSRWKIYDRIRNTDIFIYL